MMRRIKRKGARLCSILMALVLILSLMPTQLAFASDTDSETMLEVLQPMEEHEDEPAPAREAGGTSENVPKREKKANDEPVKSDDEEEKPASAEKASDISNENATAADTDAEDPAASSGDDAAQDEDSTDADPLTETAEPSDSGENDVQAGEDEKTPLPTEPTETPKKEVVLEETMEEEPALSAAPARGSRALSLQKAKAGLGVGSTCPYCGEGTLSIDTTGESYHYLKCSNAGCKHYGGGNSIILISDPHWGGNATCTNKAVCEGCGREYGNLNQNNHDWGEWKSNQEADGNTRTHTRTCKRDGCGATETKPHDKDGVAISVSSGHSWKCNTCGAAWGVSDHNYQWTYMDEDHHKGTCECRWEITENHTGGAATCVSGPICEKCGEEYDTPLSHDWGAWTPDADGVHHTRTCKHEGCGATENASHSYTWTYVDDDTCKGVCECGAETTEAHYDRWASTCGHQPHCEKCDHDYGVIPEHEMWYEDYNESGHKPSCYHCDTYFFIEPHTFGDWKDKGDGTHTGVCVCGRTQTEGHSGGAATCTEKATCETCGVKYGKPLGHDLVHHDAQAATCTEVGWEAYETCSRCDYTTYKEIPALGHDLVHHDAQAVTCTEVGWEAYDTCSRCDYTTYKEIAALGHDLKEMAKVEPTCTEAGTEAYWTCQRDGCGKLFSDAEGKTGIEAPVVIPVLGHELKETAKVEPTCTKTGTEAYWTCQRDGCGKLFSDAEAKTEIEALVVIKALGHDWGEWQVTKAPQIGKTGERQRICSRCKEKETEAIATLIGYDVISGADGSWTKGSDKAYTITVKRSEDDASCFAHYVETLIDGKKVVVSAKAGSTVVTISAGTLEKLSAGTHTVTVKFDDGQTTTKLTVKNRTASTDSEPSEPADSNPSKSTGPHSPQTGDNSNIGLWFALMLLSASAVTALLISGRKKKTRS